MSDGYLIPPDAHQNKDAKKYAQWVYALQALAFFFAITYFVAIVLNYVKKADMRGTIAESHFRWQIRTFWFSILWAFIGTFSAVVGIGYLVLFANAIWIIYRIVKGWLALNEGKEMYRS